MLSGQGLQAPVVAELQLFPAPAGLTQVQSRLTQLKFTTDPEQRTTEDRNGHKGLNDQLPSTQDLRFNRKMI